MTFQCCQVKAKLKRGLRMALERLKRNLPLFVVGIGRFTRNVLAVDSSGFSTSTYVRWFDVKYGNNEDWHDWLKMHLMCGVKTHIVTSVESSRATANDSPFFKPLLQQTAKAGFNMLEVSADKGYISMKNLQATVDHGAVPFIPFKSNTQPDRGTDIWSKMFHFYNYKREEFLAHYHKRSNVESVF